MSSAPAYSLLGRTIGITIVGVAIAGGGQALAGGPSVVLWATAVVVATALLARWTGWALALAGVTGAFFMLEFAVLRLAALLGIGMPVADIVVWTPLLCLAGVAVAVWPRLLSLPTGRVLALGSFAAIGSVLIVATVALAQVLPGALKLAWAMNGDFVNGILFARRMLVDGGIDPVSTPQPTALPFAMMAANMASGREALPAGALLEHDIGRSAQVWIFVIAISCLLAGTIAARTVRMLRLALAVPVIVIASCMGLTWYVIGVQFQFGFINSSFAIAVLLAAWLAYLAGERRPLLALCVLLILGTAMLAVWSPLIVGIAGLGVVLLVRNARSIFAPPRLRLLAAAIAPAVFLAYALAFTVPSFLSESSFLSSGGGFPAIGSASHLVIASITALLAFLVGRIPGQSHTSVGVIGFVGSFLAGLLYLLLQRAGEWGYYPAKFAWTASITMVVMIITLIGTLLVRYPPRTAWERAAFVTTVALIAALLWEPASAPRPQAQLPLMGILTGDAFGQGNHQADMVFALTAKQDEQGGQDILWRSTTGDFWTNFWLLQIDGNDPADNAIRTFAHHLPVMTPEEVCEIADLVDETLVVHTADPTAGTALREVCSDEDFRVELGY